MATSKTTAKPAVKPAAPAKKVGRPAGSKNKTPSKDDLFTQVQNSNMILDTRVQILEARMRDYEKTIKEMHIHINRVNDSHRVLMQHHKYMGFVERLKFLLKIGN